MNTPMNIPKGVAIQYANEKDNLLISFLNTIYPNGFTFEEVVKKGEWVIQNDVETFIYNGQMVFSTQLIMVGNEFRLRIMHGNYYE